ncbi:chemotaxis protein CheD [Clostridium tertium]|uniref:chemotaxis protein CheD n=1 Tax=Clostridium TaxID=1485 RepID=UPI00115775BF|nr:MULTISPECIES: chemotaxis protein CheD [Clostridium]MBS5307409.1 chemotaxis protein CheD [Clostridium sp.]MDB1922491.1 chemotaxis protein CheD [Clostridium tertium]MDB1926292.1 chemotaxis protein CheD [Clostridium tertium]MDB1928848.1 chemotaxis protein CheD [Clostridium tertium]MDB1932228.1 chemotaxis protein CheD [Clostridium tertium]
MTGLEDKKEVRVGIADGAIVSVPDKLITMGLGSCVGIALYDKEKKIAGLVHIMLPDSTQFKNILNPFKYADLGVQSLLEKMLSLGCRKDNIVAKIAGGASMFNFPDKKIISDVGKRNSTAVIEAITKLSIPIIGEDIGGNKGRTMILESEDGAVTIKSIGNGLRRL